MHEHEEEHQEELYLQHVVPDIDSINAAYHYAVCFAGAEG